LNRHEFQLEDFRRCHPGGALGERLRVPIEKIMRTGSSIPKVQKDTLVAEAIQEMDAKTLGATLVIGDKAELVGIVTDGDLRRGLRKYEELLKKPVAAIMSKNPKTVQVKGSVADALEIMEEYQITVLAVTGSKNELLGIIHLHDLLGKGYIRFTM
jgi:arabinose-5-phosphate isomerase